MEDLVRKIEKLKEKKDMDLSLEEDLSIAIMNLISLEEHFFYTYEKTKKQEYFDYLNTARELRKKLLAKMIPENEGETWCISKHLLATTMRLMEVGTKYQTMKKEKEAKAAFDDAYTVNNMFWAIRLKLMELKDLRKNLPKQEEEKPWDMDEIMKKLIDCCRE